MIPEEDKAKAIERANSYRQMMDLWAWKDLQSFLESTRTAALESAVISDEIKDIQMWRGYVKCLDSINSHIGYILGAP